MKRTGFLTVMVFLLVSFSAYSQCEYSVSRMAEVDCVSKTVIQAHLNDEFYLQIRCLPDHRMSTDDYYLTKSNGIWKAEHRMKMNDSSSGANGSTPEKGVVKVLKMDNEVMDTFLASIDIDRLVKGSKIDSLSLDDSNMVLGIDCYAIMICSKGTFKLYEYPIVFHNEQLRRQNKIGSIYWKSAYVDNLIKRFIQALTIKN